MIPPVDRQMLTHCVLKVELGKPVFLLHWKDSRPQSLPMGMRVEERWRKRMLICNGSDTGSKLPGHENVQTSGMVLNHVKRFEME